METICISVGGSILIGSEGLNVRYIKNFVDLLASYKDLKFVVVTGGGETARKYMSYGKNFTTNQQIFDDIAIGVTRLNAMLMLSAANGKIDTYPNVATTIQEMKEAMLRHRLAVSGGLYPGITTDAVTVLYAEALGSKKVVNVSNVPYVYETSDIENSKPIKKLGYERLIEIAARYDSRDPGSNFVFDLVGCKLAKRSGIKIYFTNDDIKELKKILDGKEHNGTVVE
ncbi:MAG: UMP kinase [Candidatus Micrarchaeaceae archaeon]